MPQPLADHWNLEAGTVFLNHGSFGACPRAVLDFQADVRARLEAQPVRFMLREMGPQLDHARGALAEFIGADAADIGFVSNATTGVNTVLRSLSFQPGDELLTTDHAYKACQNALDFVANRWGANVMVARVPFPDASANAVVEAVLDAVTPRTRLVLLDHVTSPTGLVFPLERLVAELTEKGVDVLVDGAHAPGMVPLAVDEIGAAYYTGNCHKWMCAPKGAAFLHVRRDRQEQIVPTTVSHGANSSRADRSRFRLLFDWAGTEDPSAYLSVPEAIRFMGTLLPGGWEELMDANRNLALQGRNRLCAALGVAIPAPDDMIGSLASIPLPDGSSEAPLQEPGFTFDPLQDHLFALDIEVPIVDWPAPPRRLIRLSAQAYNNVGHYDRLASALVDALVYAETGARKPA